MRSFFLPFVLVSLGLAANALPTLFPWTVHEQRSHTPSGWSRARKHHPDAVIPLRFALSQSNIENVEEYLYDVQQSVDAVRLWLLESGISPSRGWLEFQATVREAEDLLHTTYSVYKHETGAEHVGNYHLPEHLVNHLSRRSENSKPLYTIGQPGSSNQPMTTGEISSWIDQLEDCDQHITPICLRALYGLIYEPLAGDKNSYGIVEYTPQSYRQEDLDLFARNFSSDLVGASPIMVSIDGGSLSTEEAFSINGESNLDLEYGMNLVTSKQNVTLYQVGDMVTGASFNNFLDALDGTYCTFEGGDDPTADAIYPDTEPGGYDAQDCGTVTPANVISTSYGYNEADLTPAYAARQCAEYAKLGLMGVTFVFSSGDSGVAGGAGYCLNPDGNAPKLPDGTIFNPSFPSTCPYVTSIGATQVSPGKSVYDSEDACETIIYSGGGFSNYFAVPDYQKDAVSSYLQNYPPALPSNVWNSTGNSRAFPDISANGANYVVAVDGTFGLVYGTSASSPVVGAILTMVNDARIAIGKGPIGFINPVIYSADFTDGFNDITNGTNQALLKGWDPVTGLGTPNFPKLLTKWLLMP
ncbi:peptidase S8/S53 domain-containing protein [Melanogaster broomeanus]|nr:peptidase S8/S53 domain-containing protein [Melanogaster broomeanus]